MRKKIILIVILITASAYHYMSAQGLEKAQELHKQFNIMRMEESQATEAEIYSTLYLCYKEYVAILDTAQTTSLSYEPARSGLLEIHQYLYNGAAYHQTRGVKQNSYTFAQAYIDVTLMKAYSNHKFIKDEQFAAIAYLAASGAYNAKNFDKAIPYLAVYLSTGDQRNRENAYAFMAKACVVSGKKELAMVVFDEAVSQYPQNFNILSTAINYCQENEITDKLGLYVALAVAIKPNDEALLNIQGQLYEKTQEFGKALEVYKHLDELKPNNLTITQHIALNYYNLGVVNFNKANLQQSESEANRYETLSKGYFASAVAYMNTILLNLPNEVKYMQALAVAYDCMGNIEEFETMNYKLAEIGASTVEANITPTLMNHSSRNLTLTNNQGDTSSASNNASSQSNILQILAQQETIQQSDEAPLYSVYAKEYVEPRIKAWQEKDPYETVAEYQERVSEEAREAKKKEFLKAAEANYIRTYAGRVRVKEMKLKPYDADNQAFLIESPYGELIVPVPREMNEAAIFERNWNGMQVKEPEFYISNDKLLLSALTFITPTGNTYRYDNKNKHNYVETVVDITFEPINTNLIAANTDSEQTSRVKKQTLTIDGVKSDVDINIPERETKSESSYALIIANENYEYVSGVSFALNDGEMFSEYCKKTLGIPEKNVLLYRDASVGVMGRAVDKVKALAEAQDGNMELILYYAGHGIPDESSMDAYLLPVDSDGKQTKYCYSLNDLYQSLGALNMKSVTVFLDACFSGAKRDGGMVVEARAVALAPKPSAPRGNMVVFSAVSNDQTALPYKEKGHGMFTYFLLKKLQETSGDVTLKELGDYLRQEVNRESVRSNDKPQTPTVTAAFAVSESWQQMKLIKE